MAFRAEIGWQCEKTLSECMRHMLDNEIATDVCFEVGPLDCTTVNIRAHKFMLISRSPVFEGMFSCGMTECLDQKIRIEDIAADTFKDFLTYVYSEQVDMTIESAFPLMYAAKKYMFLKLVEICRKSLEQYLNVYSAHVLLEESLRFCDDELVSKCVSIIARNSERFLSERMLLSATRQAVEAVLECDELRSSESLVYKFCLRWANQQLLDIDGIQNPTDEQIRETLGGLIYRIRIPIMAPMEFSNLVGQENVLNPEEKLSLHSYLSTRSDADRLLFSTQARNQICPRGEELCVDRVAKRVNGTWRGPAIDAIDFSANQDIVLTGIGLYSGHHDYIAEIKVVQCGNTIYRGTESVSQTVDSTPYKISFNTPIVIECGMISTISVSRPNNDNNIAYYAESCHRSCRKGKVTFIFATNSQTQTNKHWETTDAFGQIPRLYFKKF